MASVAASDPSALHGTTNELSIGSEKNESADSRRPPYFADIESLSSLPLSSADGLIKEPFARPLDSTSPLPRPPLTAEQKEKYEHVLKVVSSWTEVPESSAQGAPKTPITDNERLFLTRECLLRYLRATKWVKGAAEARLLATLAWRREYGVEKLTFEYCSDENKTGKQLILGYDGNARPCLYLLPSKQNTARSDKQIQFLVFMLERVIDLMVPGQESLTLLIDFAETKAGQGASLGQGRQTLHILQNHYPERLGRSLVVNVPLILSGFFKLIGPFIDPMTREKIQLNEDMGTYVPRAQLLRKNGGEVEFEHDHAVYWPALRKLAETKRAAYVARWQQAGKHVGESEDYLCGGNARSLFGATADHNQANGVAP